MKSLYLIKHLNKYGVNDINICITPSKEQANKIIEGLHDLIIARKLDNGNVVQNTGSYKAEPLSFVNARTFQDSINYSLLTDLGPHQSVNVTKDILKHRM